MKSYEDCQGRRIVTNCRNSTDACFQGYIKFDNGSTKIEQFIKSCTSKSLCEQLNKGNFSRECYQPFSVCKGQCCYEDDCNKGELLDTTGHTDSNGNKHGSGKAPVTSCSVMVLFCIVLVSLTVVN